MYSVVFLAVLLAWGGLTVSGHAKRYVSLHLELPNGDVREMRTPEGTATAQIQLKDGREWRAFYLDLDILDAEDCAVLVSIRNSRQAGAEAIDEFELREDGPLTTTSTVPAFGVALRDVEDCGVAIAGAGQQQDDH
jgi:hypothetical protein